MDANTLSRIGLLTALLASPSAMANDNIVVLQLGNAFSNEKLDINIADAKFHHCSGLIIPDTILGGTVATMT
ncbi:hypothetical protein [Aeromonas veronii]|uniref:hypothetical protein n=1 Tax=Aeromonas veronii TaxID=654 RepID=UPI003F745817